MMEGEFTSSERQTIANRNATFNNPGGNLVTSVKDKTYQCTGAHCSETSNIDLYQR